MSPPPAEVGWLTPGRLMGRVANALVSPASPGVDARDTTVPRGTPLPSERVHALAPSGQRRIDILRGPATQRFGGGVASLVPRGRKLRMPPPPREARTDPRPAHGPGGMCHGRSRPARTLTPCDTTSVEVCAALELRFGIVVLFCASRRGPPRPAVASVLRGQATQVIGGRASLALRAQAEDVSSAWTMRRADLGHSPRPARLARALYPRNTRCALRSGGVDQWSPMRFQTRWQRRGASPPGRCRACVRLRASRPRLPLAAAQAFHAGKPAQERGAGSDEPAAQRRHHLIAHARRSRDT